MPKAREAALKAIELDEELPEAHHSLAMVKWFGDWDWEGAEREYKRALDLYPNLLHIRLNYADFLNRQKRFEEALHVIRQAREYDPASLRVMRQEGSIYSGMRQYDRAAEIFRKILEINPDYAPARRRLSIVLSRQGRHQDAISEIAQFQTTDDITLRVILYWNAGRRSEALKLFREVKAIAAREHISPVYIASIYVCLGDKELAFDWLHKAYDQRSDHLLHLGISPDFDPLRSDPRFDELLRGIGLAR
jgi:serine/threonine-protein kinase